MSSIKTEPKQNEKSVMDALNENPKFQEMKGLFEIMEKLNEGGTDQDTMPDGYGEFGLEVTNPIPVNTVMGSVTYLGKLRTLNGTKIQYERICSTSAKNVDQAIDEYAILENGQKITSLFICPYNKKNSERPPKGFKISPLP